MRSISFSKYDSSYRGGSYPQLIHLPSRAPAQPLRLLDLPTDILFLILDSLLPAWALGDSPRGPTWTVGDLTAPLDISVATDNFHALALVSHHMGNIATPYLYRIIHMRDISTVLSLWTTLSRLRPSNATHIRHLLFGLDLRSWATICHVARVVMPLFTQQPSPSVGAEPPFRWADRQALVRSHLYSSAPPITQRICFDIVRRSVHVQSLGIMPPAHWDVNASFLFRQALDMAASTSLLRPATVVLERLRVITLQIKDSCRQYLSAYGILTLPLLRRLTLTSEAECWLLDLSDSTERDRSTILQKVRSLSIVWGRRSLALNGDLRLGLESLPYIQSLAVYCPRAALAGQYVLRATPAAPADLNPQLSQHAPNLKILDLSWCLEPDSQAWPYLGPSKRLVCLPRLRNLVRLQISTQLLFGTLPKLQKRLQVPEEHEDQTEGERHSRLLSRLLPESLQLITLIEWWPATELGRYDSLGAITLDTWHEQGDWMEARFRDEAAFREDAPLGDMIHTAHDVAMLGLMKVLCRRWLAQTREGRAVELRPQNPHFYGAFTHRVLLAVAGLERLLSRIETRQGFETFSYRFVEAVYLRGVKAVVDQRRP